MILHHSPCEPLQPAPHLASNVRCIFNKFVVASARLRAAGQSATTRRLEALSLGQHSRHFALLRLRELRCYDDQAQVDEEKSADLQPIKQRMYLANNGQRSNSAHIPPLTGKPEQRRFTIRSGVLTGISSRQRSAFSVLGSLCFEFSPPHRIVIRL